MPRIGQPGYLPSDQDILRARVRSTGIVEEVFNINKQKLRVFDVGGQRSERKKWIHCFEGVSVLTFVAALSEYDQTLYEDESVNRLVESTTLWESIASSRLNKTDLFVAKVTSGTAPLSRYFSDYTGPDNDVAAASKYMSAKFVALGRKKERALYSTEPDYRATQATSTSQTRVIISAVMDTIMNRLLTEVGLM
ncbi:SPOSA6832_02540, partial [Sporobolomyces salmonicolor]